MSIRAFVDGCRKKSGEGGWGAIIYHSDQITFLGGYQAQTTNNVMELLGPIHALERCLLLPKQKINICSDAKYFVNGFNDWMHRWHKRNWKRGENGVVANLIMWERLYDIKAQLIEVKAEWVKGHSGHKENELCDKVANYCCSNRVNISKTIENNGRNILGGHEISHLVAPEDKTKIHSDTSKHFLQLNPDGRIVIRDGRSLEEYLNDPYLIEKRKQKYNLSHPIDIVFTTKDRWMEQIPHCA